MFGVDLVVIVVFDLTPVGVVTVDIEADEEGE